MTIQSYRHRYGNAPGDPALEEIERRLADLPKIGVPTIALQGEADGVQPSALFGQHDRSFTGPFARRILPGIGHNPPQEAPAAFAGAILALLRNA